MTELAADTRFLVAQLEPGLSAAEWNFLFHVMSRLAGVRCVYEFTDLTGLTKEQLLERVRHDMQAAQRRNQGRRRESA